MTTKLVDEVPSQPVDLYPSASGVAAVIIHNLQQPAPVKTFECNLPVRVRDGVHALGVHRLEALPLLVVGNGLLIENSVGGAFNRLQWSVGQIKGLSNTGQEGNIGL